MPPATTSAFLDALNADLDEIERTGTYKREHAISSAQSATIDVAGASFLNLCANNYLGLADDARLVRAARAALDEHGYGMASVRFICGTHELHRELECALARFLGKDDAILYAACFDANGGLFEPLLGPDDAIVSDALNHASLIDGIRLCKAVRHRYANGDLDELETRLREARRNGARHVMIATDGVFSMDGTLAKLADIVALARRHDALVMVDDCHATGFMGEQGRGTPSRFGVAEGVDILTGTLGKALGGAIGGYTAGPQAVIDTLRQRSRPYLFSNALPPMVCAAGLEALRIVEEGDGLRARLEDNARYWRAGLERLGFDLLPGEHPIVPVMAGEAHAARRLADGLQHRGVFVSAFSYPVVPRGQARIRTQMSSALTREQLDGALGAFEEAGREAEVLR